MSRKSSEKNDLSAKVFFEDSYRQHLRKVQFYANSYLGDENESKSVAQDVFLTLWENLQQVDTERDILPYLIVIAKFKCLNIIRQRRTQRRYRDEKNLTYVRDMLATHALNDFTSTYLYSEEIRELVDQSLSEIPPPVKATFELSRKKNLNNREIARLQFISVKTVEYRISYALKILRKKLQDYSFWILLFSFIFHYWNE